MSSFDEVLREKKRNLVLGYLVILSTPLGLALYYLNYCYGQPQQPTSLVEQEMAEVRSLLHEGLVIGMAIGFCHGMLTMLLASPAIEDLARRIDMLYFRYEDWRFKRASRS